MAERVRSVVLLSGGLDSAANLALCVLQDEAALALTADYGQRAAARELKAAEALCRHFGVSHQKVDLTWLGRLGGSALTDSSKPMPGIAASELDDSRVTRSTARAVWVPNRNGVLINVAAAYAERLGARRVVVGFNREEAETFPDNSVAYLRKATEALAYSTANATEVHCYTAELDKREIVALLRERIPGFPFDRVWSCYEGGDAPCGACESCRRFARASGGAK